MSILGYDNKLYPLGTRVRFTLGRNTPYETKMVGTIIAIHPYGPGEYYVIEYYCGIDFALHMEYNTLVEEE